MGAARRILDICVCSVLVYASVWIYELGNFFVLLSAGAQPSMAFLGVLPVGVSAVSSGLQGLALAKPIQVAVCGTAMFAILCSIRPRNLPISAMVASATLSIYLASSYWELVSLIGTIPYAAHLAVFTALAIVAQQGLARILRLPSLI